MKTVYIINGNAQYRNMFLGEGWTITNDIGSADLVQFTGGSDVSPQLYHQVPDKRTHSDPHRDLEEVRYFTFCWSNDIPMTGICRGGQFLNVMCGGSMIQHVEGHALSGSHSMRCDLGCTSLEEFPDRGEFPHRVEVSSTHHQMMIEGDRGEVLYRGCDMGGTESLPHNEVIFYSYDQVLCYQPHPEFPGEDDNRELYFTLLEEMLGV